MNPEAVSRSDTFRAKLELEPRNLLFQFSLGQALAAEGKNSDALEPLRICSEEKPDWMAPRILLGKCLIAEGRESAAEEVLSEALALAIEQGHDDPATEIRELCAEIKG